MAEVIGLEKLLARLEGIRARARDMRPAFDDAADVALDSIDRNFAEGGRPEPWEPHAPATLRSRIGPRRLLDESGDLRGSFKKKVSGKDASVFPTDWKAAFHEKGTKRLGRPHIPARRFVMLQDEDIPVIGAIFEERLFG